MIWIKNIFALFKDTFLIWKEDKASRWAAALAYYAIFALTPLLIIIIAVLGFFYGERAAQNDIAYHIEGMVGPQIAEFIQNIIVNIHNQGKGVTASLISIITMLFGASGLFMHLQEALNAIWRIPDSGESGVTRIIKQRLLLFTLVIGLGGLILFYQLFTLLFSTLLSYLGVSTILEQVNQLVSFVMLSAFFALIFRILPEINIPWRDVWLGGIVTAGLFTIGQYLILFYITNRNFGIIYGAAGSVIVILLWVYYSAQILLFGAEFTHLYAIRYGSYLNQLIDSDKTSK